MAPKTPPSDGSLDRPHRGVRRLLAALGAALAAAGSASAEEAQKAQQISDNSFLIEEAYNQEAGVVQNIATFMRDRATGDWVGTFTQEWPLGGEDHQLSYTVALSRVHPGSAGMGDLLVNYRYQLLSDWEGIAIAPRLSALLPTGDAARQLGLGGYGAQVNVPVSAELGSWLVSHTNAGGTWVPSGRALGEAAAVRSVALGEGLVVRVHPRFNLLVEALWTVTDVASAGATSRTRSLLVSPGFRTSFDFPGGLQVVTGVGVPLGVGPSAGSAALLGYLSFEFPYIRAAAKDAPAAPARTVAPARASPDGKGGEPEVAASR